MIFYRLILIVLTPLVALRLLWALARRRETLQGLGERLGLGRGPAGAGVRLWLHGASLGELNAARALIERILAANADMGILVTCNSYTARAMVAGWGLARLEVRLAPLDAPLIVAHFLRRWHPVAMITLENELWPARIIMSAREGLPVMVVGGRMSPRSAAFWQKLGPVLTRRVMGAISCLAPADRANGERFAQLGLSRERIAPPVNLKAFVETPPPPPEALAALQGLFERAQTVLAASTHEGEDGLILDAFRAALDSRPALRLILAPRHPERAAAIARLIDSAGLRHARRSAGELPGPGVQVYLADTVGEMALFHTLAGVSIMGGSFQPVGGHTPVEAVQFASVVIHGPDVSNHREIYAALAADRGCLAAGNAQELAAHLRDLGDGRARAEMAARASATLDRLRAGTDGTDQVLDRLARLLRHHRIS